VKLSVTEAGEGPLVLLVHGFPELGFSWRHQVPALVAAGYRVAVPDMRGYGRSDRPVPIDAYSIDHLTSDLMALADHYDSDRVVLIGHDWGAMVVWAASTLHSDRVAAVAGLSVPFLPRGPVPPTVAFRALFGDNFFYMLYFQEPGVADAELNADPGDTIRRIISAAAGGEDGDIRSAFGPEQASPGGGMLDRVPPFKGVPPWMTEDEMAEFVARFTETGFTGGLNYYRNLDRNWELTESTADVKATMPAAFITGSHDVGAIIPMPGPEWVTDLRVNATIDGAGHWLHQERPAEVNRMLVEFLAGIERDGSTWS
jgi:pimeloyl-ACP methyl ester carboxylesterase